LIAISLRQKGFSTSQLIRLPNFSQVSSKPAPWQMPRFEENGEYLAPGAFECIKLTLRRGTLSKAERKSYTDAVLCLMSKPARTDSKVVPGAKSRYDDFLYTHINQTLSIHGTANFLSWHRYFTWTYEQALRNECGYTGYQPVCSPLSHVRYSS
jgi:hypothetical protein